MIDPARRVPDGTASCIPDTDNLHLTSGALRTIEERQTMTEEILMELWKIEDLSKCKEGMTIARDFLQSCISALHSGNAANFNARFENFKQHRDSCEQCRGLMTAA